MAMAILTKSVLVEAYQSIRMVKRAYLTLRQVYQIIIEELQDLGIIKELALQMAVKATNNIASLDGLVLILLVFGAYP